MKILAINASPRGASGCTEHMLKPLLEGMREAQAKTETIYLDNKNIHHCIGCFSCWLKTPGICVFKDDMPSLLKKLTDSDLIVFGTPLYCYTMSGLLKNFFDRTLPLSLPFMEKLPSGAITHVSRYPTAPKKCLLVSPCGFPELSQFDALVATVKKIMEVCQYEYLGEILRPTAQLMNIPEFTKISQKYFIYLKEAGYQLIKNNEIDKNLHSQLQQPWVSTDNCIANANKYFKSELEKLKKN